MIHQICFDFTFITIHSHSPTSSESQGQHSSQAPHLSQRKPCVTLVHSWQWDSIMAATPNIAHLLKHVETGTKGGQNVLLYS